MRYSKMKKHIVSLLALIILLIAAGCDNDSSTNTVIEDKSVKKVTVNNDTIRVIYEGANLNYADSMFTFFNNVPNLKVRFIVKDYKTGTGYARLYNADTTLLYEKSFAGNINFEDMFANGNPKFFRVAVQNFTGKLEFEARKQN